MVVNQPAIDTAVNNDGDMLKVLDVLARDVGLKIAVKT